MFAVNDGLWSGNFNAADWLFVIAAVIFAIAAILPHTHRRVGETRVDFDVSLVPLGLCLVSIGFAVL